MTTLHSLPCAARFLATLLAGIFGAANAAFAQTAATATLTGRVLNAPAGSSLEKARVTITGTNREAFTDAFGDYRLRSLRAR